MIAESLRLPYPEVNIEVACATELAIANLEGDGHLVVPTQGLVEAFESVGGEDDVVRRHSLEGHGGCEESPRCREQMHFIFIFN